MYFDPQNMSKKELFTTVLSYYYGDSKLNDVSLILKEMSEIENNIYLNNVANLLGVSKSDIVYYKSSFLLSCEPDIFQCNLSELLDKSLSEIKEVIKCPEKTALLYLKNELKTGREWLEASFQEGQSRLSEKEGEEDENAFLPEEYRQIES